MMEPDRSPSPTDVSTQKADAPTPNTAPTHASDSAGIAEHSNKNLLHGVKVICERLKSQTRDFPKISGSFSDVMAKIDEELGNG